MSSQSPATSLGEFTSTGAAKVGNCLLANVLFNPGTTTSAVTLSDGNGGLILYKLINVAANSGPVSSQLSIPIVANNGIYVSAISGTGSSVVISIVPEV